MLPQISFSMEFVYFFFLLVFFYGVLKSLHSMIQYKNKKLPPGPLNIPIFSQLQWFRRSFADLEPILKNLSSKYGPILTLQIGHRKSIFIASHKLAHQALIQNATTFSDRPPPPETTKFINSNNHSISAAPYGSLWRLLRRNLAYHIQNPSRIKSFSPFRKWVMELLKKNLINQYKSGQPVRVIDHFQYAIFCLLVLMCFGEISDDKLFKEIEVVQRALPLSFNRLQILNVFPILGKVLFRNRWRELHELRNNQRKVILPLIKARKEKQKIHQQNEENDLVVAYVDTLLNLNLPDEGRKLNENEIISLCSEFLTAGTDTTSTALQWIMANLVKNPNIQSKITDEIRKVVKQENDIEEDDLEKMIYLKAVVLEGLRRHPPSHFVLPHAATEDIYLEGYQIPKEAMINFMVAEIGRDPKLWKEPMEFKPERFLSSEGSGEEFDITGSREIKMMPFGAGRRICPALGLALLHLEYIVANLVREFEWTAGKVGDNVDLREKQEFTVVMKNPLWAHISPRIKNRGSSIITTIIAKPNHS